MSRKEIEVLIFFCIPTCTPKKQKLIAIPKAIKPNACSIKSVMLTAYLNNQKTSLSFGNIKVGLFGV